ncbi:hypothetical protein [Mycolicibacterium sp. 120320]|uniref:hypothetical protein n=1 Tax=unclassified Mycolicibacterium TaxID=2636767 RepID=UPI003FA57038
MTADGAVETVLPREVREGDVIKDPAAGCRLLVKNAVRLWALQPNLHWPLDSIDRIAGWAPTRLPCRYGASNYPHVPLSWFVRQQHPHGARCCTCMVGRF